MIEVEVVIGPVTFHVAPPAIESFVIATLAAGHRPFLAR